MHHYNIKPKEGLGDVKFLSTVDEFISMIGQPDDDELIQEKISKFNSRILHYDSLELSASFDEENNWKLSSITVNSDAFHINDIYLFNCNKIDFLKKIEPWDLGTYESDVYNEEDYSSTTYYFKQNNISFWFENDALQKIQWGIIHVWITPTL